MTAAYKHHVAGLGSSNSVAVNPAGLTHAAGDGLLLIVAGYTSLAAPSGSDITWTEVGTGKTQAGPFGNTDIVRAWRGYSAGGSPSSFTVAMGASDQWGWVLSSWSDVDSSNFIDAFAFDSSTFDVVGNPTAASVDPATESGALVAFAGVWPSENGTSSFAAPGGYTERWDAESWDSYSMATSTFATGDATGSKAFTETPTLLTGAWITFHAAIKSAAGGGPTAPSFDQVALSTSTANRSATGNISHTVTSGKTNVIVLAFIASRADETISGGTPPTYAGSAMTLLGSIGNGATNSDPKIWVYGILRGNTTGTNNCVVTYGATVNPDWVVVVGYSDCAQTLPPGGDVFTNTGTSNSPSVAGTTLATGSRLVGAYTAIGGDVDPSTPSGVNERADVVTGTSTTADDGGAVGDVLEASGSATYAATMAASDKWAAIAVELALVSTDTPIAGADTPTATLAEAASIVASLSRSDTPTLSIVDAVSTLVSTLSRNDTPAAAVTDASAVQAGLAASDAPVAAVTETSVPSVLVAAIDTPTLSLAEAVALLAGLVATDAQAITLAEAASLLVAVAVSDTAATSLLEAAVLLASLSAVDAPEVGVTDASATPAVVLLATDSPAAGVTDSSQPVTAGLAAADAATISVAETRLLVVSIATGDAPTLAVTEDRSLLVSLSVTDAAAASLSESTAVAVVVSSADGPALSLAEAATVAVAVSTADTAGITLVEAVASINVSLLATDTSAVQLGETTALVVSLAAADLAAAAVADSAIIAVALSRADAVALGLVDVASLDTGGTTLVLVSALDAVTVAVVEDRALVIVGPSWRRFEAAAASTGRSDATSSTPAGVEATAGTSGTRSEVIVQ